MDRREQGLFPPSCLQQAHVFIFCYFIIIIIIIIIIICCRHGSGQLKVMFIGGPNQRKDYHLDEGEEVWFTH